MGLYEMYSDSPLLDSIFDTCLDVLSDERRAGDTGLYWVGMCKGVLMYAHAIGNLQTDAYELLSDAVRAWEAFAWDCLRKNIGRVYA